MDSWCECTLCGKWRIVPADEEEDLKENGDASCTTILEACGRVGDCRTPLTETEEGLQDWPRASPKTVGEDKM